jgi:DNA-binding XRE family transcriptional regulator
MPMDIEDVRIRMAGRLALASAPPRESWAPLRHDAGLSAEEMAAFVGCTRGSIFHWECGRRTPRGEHAVKYVAALHAFAKIGASK